MDKRVELYDSTLRDGAQGEGIAFSVEDKITITKLLDHLGIQYIEAGNPASNPKEMEYFKRSGKIKLEQAKICAFGSTRRCGVKTEEDANLAALIEAGTGTVAIFGKSWDMHVSKVLRTTLHENLDMIRETIAHFKAAGKEVVFDAEHFFDGCRHNKRYAFETLKAACQGGADVLCLCDTNGAAYMTEIYEMTSRVIEAFGKRTAIHCHNDTGLAVANSMTAVDAGVTQVQGTFLGFGERCGNTDLSTLLANLQLKRGYNCIPDGNMQYLTEVSRGIAEVANVKLPHYHPYVGSCAFAHKGGMHIDGVNKIPKSFEHIAPETVGNERKILLSEFSGRSTVLSIIRKIDPSAGKSSPQTKKVMQRIKELEHYGYQFEGAPSTVELLIRKVLGLYKPFFELEHYKIIGEQPAEDNGASSTAVIKINVNGRAEITAAQGDGPVHALDCALKKALSVFYPALKTVRLIDYKVRVMEPRDASASKVRVLIETSDGNKVWTSVGVSSDIIKASWIALVNSIEYKLTMDYEKNK
ncbi:MAG TPA: citramalate synthase [Ruminiclostridium sp.]|nr:citramalate synthase [Ruminiclostridium sp.]